MRSLTLKLIIKSSSSRSSSSPALPFLLTSQRNAVSPLYTEEEAETVVFSRNPGFSYGFNWALAGKGVIVKDKAFQNLTSSELQQKGATIAASLSGSPVFVRGNAHGGPPDISKAQFTKLLKQVTTHLSSISNVFVQDGAVGSSSDCDAKVRVISDNPSALLKFSSILWKTSSRAVSHDSCPLTVYVATSISPGVTDAIGLGAQGSNRFIVADIEHSSLVLCGKAFADINGIKEALAALSGPIISARGGLVLSGRLLVLEDSVILLFALEDTIQSCASLLVSADAGVILSSQGIAPLYQTGNFGGSQNFKLPAAVVLASSDSSGIIPSVTKLCPGQAAYHFLAGYQNGKFVPAYSKFPSIDLLELAKALLYMLKDYQIPSFLVNVKTGETSVTGNDLRVLVQSTLVNNIPPFEPKGGNLQEEYNTFLSSKFQVIPVEFSF